MIFGQKKRIFTDQINHSLYSKTSSKFSLDHACRSYRLTFKIMLKFQKLYGFQTGICD